MRAVPAGSRAAAGFALLLLTLASRPAAPQALDRLEVSLVGTLARPRSNLLDDGAKEAVGGTWFGGAAEGRYGRWFGALTYLRGTVDSLEGLAYTHEAGERGLMVGYDWKPWLAFEGSFTQRVFYSSAGWRWDIPGVGVAVRQVLGDSGVQAYARLAYLPFVSVQDAESPSFSYAAEAGLAVTPRRGAITISASYRMERHDFSSGSVPLDQWDELQLRVSWRVRKAAAARAPAAAPRERP